MTTIVTTTAAASTTTTTTTTWHIVHACNLVYQRHTDLFGSLMSDVASDAAVYYYYYYYYYCYCYMAYLFATQSIRDTLTYQDH